MRNEFLRHFERLGHFIVAPEISMYRAVIAGCVSLAIGGPLAAQENAVVVSTRTVDGLVRHALSTNAELRALEAEAAAAKGQRTQAGFFKNPEVSIEIGGREVRDSGNVLQGNGTTFSIAVRQAAGCSPKDTGTIMNANAAISPATQSLAETRSSDEIAGEDLAPHAGRLLHLTIEAAVAGR